LGVLHLLTAVTRRIWWRNLKDMATANPSKAPLERASVAKPIQETAGSVDLLKDAPTRREFLYYIWGASILLMGGQMTAGLIWFIFPRFRAGEFGGEFFFDPLDLPAVGDAPLSIPTGRFHVSNTPNGLLALFGVCTHLGCLPRWVPTNTRFECPCHGSKFNADGSWIEGPAPRGLDRFVTTVVYSDGSSAVTAGDGGPIPLDSNKTITQIRVNTGSRRSGPAH
jgi:cytochrome b6-f complex iron-sulfur subunit